MKSSCGILIWNQHNELLGCKPFGRKDNLLDIPKGIKNDDESEIACVLRETYEEIGLKIFADEIQYVGIYPYTREKNLILFKYKELFDAEDIHLFHCSSYFEREGNSYPEMIGFEWVGISDIPYRFYKALLPILMEQY